MNVQFRPAPELSLSIPSATRAASDATSISSSWPFQGAERPQGPTTGVLSLPSPSFLLRSGLPRAAAVRFEKGNSMRLPCSTSYSWIASGIKSALAQNSLFGGKCFHACVIKIGYLHDISLCNHLLNFYAKSYSVSDANALFDEIDEPNLVSYSTLISANSKMGNPSFGLHLLSDLHRSQIELNSFIFSASLVACSKLKNFGLGQQIHAQAVVSGQATDSFVNTSLVDMYSKLGDLAGATTLFYQCPSDDAVMFNALMSGYVSHGECERAIWVFKQARKRFNLKASEFCFTSIIKACSDLEKGMGKQLHGLIIKMGFDSNCFVGTSLVDMYSRFGDIESMEMVLRGTKSCDIALYNATIGGFSRNGLDNISLDYFIDMMLEGFLPNDCTLSSVLKACGSLKSLDSGRVIHGIVEKSRFQQDVVVNTALIDMYAKCGSIKESCTVFGYMHERNTVSYNSLIFGHGLNGNYREAIALFNDMNNNNIDVDLATFVALLSSCCGHEWITYVHAIKHGFASELMVNDALLHSLCKNGTVDEALEFFNKMEYQNVISWTIMISGLTISGQYLDAIHFFKTMISSGISPNSFTFSSVLKACGHLSCPKEGGCFHAQCIKHGTMDHYTNSSLVDMYARCGSLKESRRLFDQHRDKDIVLWNTMVAGYAQHGYGLEALELYTLMGKNNIHPNHVTFVSFLSACSHCGLVDEGVQIFDLMVSKHRMMPSMEHYACMVDLFGRSGKLERAKRLILDMPFEADVSIWTTFLSACKLHGNLELAESATDKVMKMQGEVVPTAILISNLYSELGRPHDAEYMRKLAGPRMRKDPGLSWIT